MGLDLDKAAPKGDGAPDEIESLEEAFRGWCSLNAHALDLGGVEGHARGLNNGLSVPDRRTPQPMATVAGINPGPR